MMEGMTEETIIPEGFKRCECGRCKEIIPIINKRKEPARFKKGHNIKLDGNPSWNGGRVKTTDGYILVLARWHPYAINGYVFEHRLVMEQMLGRLLEDHEIVHHINGKKDDNRPENLQLMIRADHSRHHNIGNTNRKGKLWDLSQRRCCDCGASESWGRNWLRDKNDPNKYRCNSCGCKLYHRTKKSIST